MTEDLTLLQFVVRLTMLTILTAVATWTWARPWRTGMRSTDALAVARRARTWALIGALGAITYALRLFVDDHRLILLTGTAFIALVSAVGIDSLKHRRPPS